MRWGKVKFYSLPRQWFVNCPAQSIKRYLVNWRGISIWGEKRAVNNLWSEVLKLPLKLKLHLNIKLEISNLWGGGEKIWIWKNKTTVGGTKGTCRCKCRLVWFSKKILWLWVPWKKTRCNLFKFLCHSCLLEPLQFLLSVPDLFSDKYLMNLRSQFISRSFLDN